MAVSVFHTVSQAARRTGCHAEHWPPAAGALSLRSRVRMGASGLAWSVPCAGVVALGAVPVGGSRLGGHGRVQHPARHCTGHARPDRNSPRVTLASVRVRRRPWQAAAAPSRPWTPSRTPRATRLRCAPLETWQQAPATASKPQQPPASVRNSMERSPSVKRALLRAFVNISHLPNPAKPCQTLPNPAKPYRLLPLRNGR